MIYIILNLGVAITDVLRSAIILMGNLKLSREINLQMTFHLMHASVNKFFDRVPIGRILNRFLRDSDTMDMMLGWGVAFLVLVVFQCTVDLGVMIFTSSPIIIPFFGLYVWLSFKVQRKYQSL